MQKKNARSSKKDAKYFGLTFLFDTADRIAVSLCMFFISKKQSEKKKKKYSNVYRSSNHSYQRNRLEEWLRGQKRSTRNRVCGNPASRVRIPPPPQAPKITRVALFLFVRARGGGMRTAEAVHKTTQPYFYAKVGLGRACRRAVSRRT